MKWILLAACLLPACDDDSEAAAPDAPPEFNYIPLNEDVCRVGSEGYDADKAATSLAQVVAGETFAIEQLELCASGMGTECPACASGENPLLAALETAGSAEKSAAVVDYFRKALAYPHRWAVLGLDPEAPGVASLTQASGRDCASPKAGAQMRCASYQLETESLSADCSRPDQQFFGTATTEAATTVLGTAPAAGQAFGFVVPLIDALPPASDFDSDEALAEWLTMQPSIPVRLEYASIDAKVKEDGGCGRLTGYLRHESLVALGFEASALEPFLHEDPAGVVPPGYIQTVLTLELNGAAPVLATSGVDR